MTSTTEPKLRRTLSVTDLIVYGMLFIGITAPMGTFGVLDARSGGVTPLVFVIAVCAMGATAYSYARMSHAVPKAGSVYAYSEVGLGKGPAFFAGWMLSLDYLFIPAMAVLFMGIATHALVPSLPVWALTLAGVVLVTVLNLLGVKLATKVGMVMLIIEVIALSVFLVAGLWVLFTVGPQRPWLSPIIGTQTLDIRGVLGAATVAALAFLGFDAIASFAEETTGDTRDVGRALGWCLVVAAVLFVAQTYVASLLTPYSPEVLRAHPDLQGTAFYDMLDASIGSWLHLPITIMRSIGPVFSALVAQAAASRLLFAMGRDHDLPAFLGQVDAREGVPRNATLVSAGITLVVSTVAALHADGLETLSTMVTVGALVAFVFLHISVIGYYARSRGEGWKAAVVPIIGIIIVVNLLVDAARLALTIAAIWAVVGGIVYAARHIRGQRARS
ncbi:APC family permease [Gleimia hominis]|uniref:APC family permease n=1 Tax=Gleimia hominis TaxID=595468 RepID=UPI000C802A54|nr:APC family permease [Gleimia hominis]WIK64049.1 APC family permease [Gleimia hominis]